MTAVRCADCGFLGLRNTNTGVLDEADERFRKEAFIRGSPPRHDPLPVCARRAVDFRDEANPGHAPGILRAITKERQCDKFAAWMTSLSPREHLEMLRDTELLKLQADQRDADRRFQAEQRETDRQNQIEQNRINRRLQTMLAIVSPLVAGLITLTATYVGWLLSRR